MKKWIMTTCLVLVLAGSGCSDSFRFAPSQSQKQAAELIHGLALKINAEGTEPQSPASEKLIEGTNASLSYIGRAQVPPDIEQFDTITAQAGQDAIERPDPWNVADNILELGIGICALLGGVYGTKAIGYLRQAKEKSQALKEIVQGNELFKNAKHSNGAALITDEQKNGFKIAHEIQTPETKILVAAIKAKV